MTVPVIRELTLEDMPELLSRISDAAHESGWLNTLEFNPEYISARLVAMIQRDEYLVIGSDDVGGVLLAQVSSPWYSPTPIALEQLVYVHPSQRMGGIARALLDRYVAWAKEKGVPKVVMSANLGIAPDKVRKLYESAGFTAVGFNFHRLLEA